MANVQGLGGLEYLEAVLIIASLTFRQRLMLLFDPKMRRAVAGLVKLRRAYEYVLLQATLEGVRPVRRAYYVDYVEAMGILGSRGLVIAATFEDIRG